MKKGKFCFVFFSFMGVVFGQRGHVFSVSVGRTWSAVVMTLCSVALGVFQFFLGLQSVEQRGWRLATSLLALVFGMLMWKRESDEAQFDMREGRITLKQADRDLIWSLDALQDVTEETEPRRPAYKRLRLVFDDHTCPLTQTYFFVGETGDSSLAECRRQIKDIIRKYNETGAKQ